MSEVRAIARAFERRRAADLRIKRLRERLDAACHELEESYAHCLSLVYAADEATVAKGLRLSMGRECGQAGAREEVA